MTNDDKAGRPLLSIAESAPPTAAPKPKALAKGDGERIWLRLASAAELVDLSTGALRKRLNRTPPPKGVMRRWGGSYFIHRERFLKWMDVG
ncbi:MAG: hypothetical protein HY716_17255 [Planctomycetes bacterium]|nr:hypothetical protein [Planctomycetota bacterium]